jgi:hypothetical protein
MESQTGSKRQTVGKEAKKEQGGIKEQRDRQGTTKHKGARRLTGNK